MAKARKHRLRTGVRSAQAHGRVRSEQADRPVSDHADAIRAAQRRHRQADRGSAKNIEAVAEANRVAVEGMQALARRQVEVLQETMKEASEAVSSLSKAGSPGELAAKEAELGKSAFEKSVATMREMAEILVKSSQRRPIRSTRALPPLSTRSAACGRRRSRRCPREVASGRPTLFGYHAMRLQGDLDLHDEVKAREAWCVLTNHPRGTCWIGWPQSRRQPNSLMITTICRKTIVVFFLTVIGMPAARIGASRHPAACSLFGFTWRRGEKAV